MKKRIIAVHLLNDRSGSPLVLRQALETLSMQYAVTLYTATPSGDGFLSNLPGVAHRTLFYRRSNNKYVTLFFYLLSQMLLFVRLAAILHKDDTVYVNTLLPFGAAMAGWLRGCKVMYHIHEVSVKPESLRTFLQRIAGFTAARMLFVSQYVADSMPAGRARKEVIYNSLPDSFVEEAAYVRRLNTKTPFTVTMLCSLKAYKGVYHFMNVARMMPDLNFVLVLNAPEKDVAAFRKLVKVPANCTVHDAQKNTVPFYAQAHVVCNLSKPDGWIETFGMTLLEAMHCGRPVICPTVGGVREVVDHGIQGFAIDSANEHQICQTLHTLATQPTLYAKMSDAACKKAAAFDREHFAIAMLAAFDEKGKMVQKTNARTGIFPKTGKVVSWVKL